MVLLLCSAVMIGSLWAQDPPAGFTPHNGFSGQSEGHGRLTLMLRKERLFHVASHGYEQADGTFRLDQTVTFEGQPSQERFWILTTVREKHFTATLSDAAGSVTGLTTGCRLQLKSRVKGPLMMHQTLVITPDGTTIDNVGSITFLGIAVGHLHETITRMDVLTVKAPLCTGTTGELST